MRLIDADTLKAEFTGNFNELWHYTGIKALIDCAPTIDPKDLRPKAKWIKTGKISVRCSVCNYLPAENDYNYCPKCGAEMEGEECL